MTKFINYRTNATGNFAVMVYHTVPSKAGTPEFEHKSYVKVKDLKPAKKHRLDAKGITIEEDDPDVLEVRCPVPGCGTTCWVPLLGGEEAQRLHAHHRAAKGLVKSREAAVQSVIDDVRARGGVPRLDPRKG